jgi:PAS domain S-box-containing protein
MSIQLTPFTAALVVAVLGTPLLAGFVWRHPDRGGCRPLLALVATGGGWAACVLMADYVSGAGTTRWWHTLAYALAALSVLSWMAFVLNYTGREPPVSNRLLAALSVEPALVAVVPWLGLGAFYGPKTGVTPGTGRLAVDYAPGLLAHEAYSYLLVCVGVVLVALTVSERSVPLDRAAALSAGSLAPIGASLPYAFGATGVDPRPVGFVFAAGAFAYATVRGDLLDVTPVAHDTIVDNIRDGVFVLDENDRMIEMNPTAKRILGVEDGRVVGRHAREVLSVYPGLYERYEDVTEVEEEIGLDDGDGHRFFDVQISPLYDRADEPMGRLFLVHEITDQKRRQRELERQNEQLDQFASLVSHDLRNPMNVADGFVGLARETGDVEYLDRVEDALGRMDRLIDDVLALAREGQTITETKMVSLEAVATEAWGTVDTADATLEVVADAHLEASRDRLVRVFENLYRNAVEHGRDDVTTRVGPILDDPDHPSDGQDGQGGQNHRNGRDGHVGRNERGFYVEDDGPGISPDRRDAVLEDGFTTSEDGVGLGLSIVTSIVEAHGWEIGVTDAAFESGGARFEVTHVELADLDPDPEQSPARIDDG